LEDPGLNSVHHRLTTDDGEVFYDRLIIATGGRPNASAVPGLAGEFRAASWVVGEDSALEARNVLRTLREEPGPLVIGAAQGASYLSAAYELVLALDTALLREGIRERVPMTFVTAEPHLGHLGFGQTAAERELEQLFAQRHIASRVDVRIKRVGQRLGELPRRSMKAQLDGVLGKALVKELEPVPVVGTKGPDADVVKLVQGRILTWGV
jgi:sulfide:quinone oxidoreductase